MPDATQHPQHIRRLAGKGLLLFLIVTDVIAWIIVIWQNWTRISQFFHTYGWLFALIAEIIIPLLLFIALIALFIWVFSTPYRFNQGLRSIPIVILIILCFGVAWLIHTATYQPSSASAIDTFGNTMAALFTILGAVFAFLAAVAAILVLLNRPASTPSPIIIEYTNDERGPDLADWMKRELEHEHYVVSTKECQCSSVSATLKDFRSEVMQEKLVIALLSSTHPLIEQFKRYQSFRLHFLNILCCNFLGKGTFLLIYIEACPINQQKALSSFQPIDLNIGEEEAKQLIVARVRAALVH